MCGGRSSILHYGPLIETNYLYAPTPNGQKPECVAKQKQYTHPDSVPWSLTIQSLKPLTNSKLKKSLILNGRKCSVETVIKNIHYSNFKSKFKYYSALLCCAPSHLRIADVDNVTTYSGPPNIAGTNNIHGTCWYVYKKSAGWEAIICKLLISFPWICDNAAELGPATLILK